MAETNGNAETLRDMVVADQQITSQLPEKVTNALMSLKRGQEIRLPWKPDDEVQTELEKADQLVNRFTSAFAAKDKFTEEKQLITIRKALDEQKSKVASIVSKAMNLTGSKLRQGVNAINATLTDKRAVISVDTKARLFRFSIEEKPQVMDEALAILEEHNL